MLKAIIISLLLFLPTTYFFGVEIYLLFPVIAFLFHRNNLLEKYKSIIKQPFVWGNIKTIWLIVMIIILIVILSVAGRSSLLEIAQGPLLLLPLTLIGAYLISDKKVIFFLLILIAIESLVGVFEFCLGTNTFFVFDSNKYNFINYNSLYHTRVFGLSENSTFLSQKALVGLLILLFTNLKVNKIQLIVMYLCFVLGIIFTFGRTTLVVFLFALILFVGVQTIRILRRKVIDAQLKTLGSMVIVTIVLFFVKFSFWKTQFTRLDMVPRKMIEGDGAELLSGFGLSGVEMSGRKELWAKTIDFIQQNFWFGNYSTKFLVNGKHVHNSFLEYFSTNGAIIFILMILFIWFNLSKKNVWIISCLTLYSFGLYGILWDTSFLDILFFSVLLFGVNFNRNTVK